MEKSTFLDPPYFYAERNTYRDRIARLERYAQLKKDNKHVDIPTYFLILFSNTVDKGTDIVNKHLDIPTYFLILFFTTVDKGIDIINKHDVDILTCRFM